MEAQKVTQLQSIARRVQAPYRLTREQYDFFWKNGYLGPFSCTAENLRDLPTILHREGVVCLSSKRPIPDPRTWSTTLEHHINVGDPHRLVPEVLEICTHPSIVGRVAQLLGKPSAGFFQSRFRVKFPHKADGAPWHQDIGEKCGGYRPDGHPIPSITAWLSLDGASRESGSVWVIPGTHTRLRGDWRSGFHAGIENTGDMQDLDLSRALPAEVGPGEFYLFHSWTVHCSGTNDADQPRSGLVMRFVSPEDAIHNPADVTMVGVMDIDGPARAEGSAVAENRH